VTPWPGAPFTSCAAQEAKINKDKRMKDAEMINVNDTVFLDLVKVYSSLKIENYI